MYQISRESGKIFLQIDDLSELAHKRVKAMVERGEQEEVFVILGIMRILQLCLDKDLLIQLNPAVMDPKVTEIYLRTLFFSPLI